MCRLTRWSATLTVLVALTAPTAVSASSLIRHDVRPGATAGLSLTVTTTPVAPSLLVEMTLPAGQPALAHLWRVELWIVEADGTTTLQVPIALDRPRDALVARVIIAPHRLASAKIAVRTGPRAPLAETVYLVDVAAFAAKK